MKIHVDIVSYNSMGGHPALSFAGDFLMCGAPEDFGVAINKIDIYAHVQNNSPPLPTLESMRNGFELNIRTLPKAWLKRKRKLIEIAYWSKVGNAEELLEQHPRTVCLTAFCEMCREIVEVMPIIRERWKPSDNFDIDAFESHLQLRLMQLPTDLVELKKQLAEFKSQEKLLP